MKTMYFKEDRYLDGKPNIKLIAEEIENCKVAVEFEDVTYQLRKELPDCAAVVGYCELSGKKNKKMSIKDDKVEFMIADKVPVKRKRDIFDKEVGYIKVEGTENAYVACVKKSYLILIILLLMMFMLCGGSLFYMSPVTNEPVVKEQIRPGNDDKGSGELEKDKVEFEQSPTFRMRLNCTPTVENGKINIRLESPAEDNKGFAFVTEIYVLGEMDSKGEITKTYEEPILIYTSPMIYENENVEYGTLTSELEMGRYLGRAMYSIYDIEGNLLANTACKLTISSK